MTPWLLWVVVPLVGAGCVKPTPPADRAASADDQATPAGDRAASGDAAGGRPFSAVPPDTPLRRVPFLMAHDAATTYRHDNSLLGQVIPSQVQTQPDGGFAALLDCGVRALDVRPCRSLEGRLYMHHGPVAIERRLEDALREVVDWAGRHPEDMVLVYVSHCGSGLECAGGTEGPNEHCDTATSAVLTGLGITMLPSVDITYAEARAKGRLPNGGLVLAFTQAHENYDESIQYCAGARVRASAFADLFAYMDKVAAQPSPSNELVITQAHWQDPHTTLLDGCAETVLQMESASQLNREVARRISAGQWPHLNLLEVDNACDQGPELAAALWNQFTRQISGTPRPSRPRPGRR